MSFSFEPHTFAWSLSGNRSHLSQMGVDVDPQALKAALLYHQFEREPINNDPRDAWCILDTPFDPYGGSDGNMFYIHLMKKAAHDATARREIHEREIRRAEQMDEHWRQYQAPVPGFPHVAPLLPPQTHVGNAYGYGYSSRG